MNEELLNSISLSLSELEKPEKIKKLLNKAIQLGIPSTEIIEKGLRKGLEEVGRRYESYEYFLSELLFSASLMKDALEVLAPYLEEDRNNQGTIVLGTVKGDLHDIGKNIFKAFAQASGFVVIDLGVDVDPDRFVDKLLDTKAAILGLSALLTTTKYEMKAVIEKIVQASLRNKVKILIGGNAVDKEFAEEIGSDAAALNAVEGVEICKKWVN